MPRPPYSSGPPWDPTGYVLPGRPLTGPPAPPPRPSGVVAQATPCVGTILPVDSTGSVTSLTFKLNANAGDGVVLFALATGTGPTSATATYQSGKGDTFSLWPVGATSFVPTTWALWAPSLSDTNPTITVKCASGHLFLWAVQIIGANDDAFVDTVVPLHVAAGATFIQPQAYANSPNDLMLCAGNVAALPITSISAGYTLLQTTVANTSGSNYGAFLAYASSPIAAGTIGPRLNFASSQAGAIAFAIRAAGQYPAALPLPSGVKLPLMPPAYAKRPYPIAWLEQSIASASAAITEALDTLSGAATVSVTASAAITEALDTLTGTAAVLDTGQENQTEANNALGGAGTVLVTSSAAITQANQTAADAVTVLDTGVEASTEAGDSLAGAASVAVTMSASLAQAPEAIAASGTAGQVAAPSLQTGGGRRRFVPSHSWGPAEGWALSPPPITGHARITHEHHALSATAQVAVGGRAVFEQTSSRSRSRARSRVHAAARARQAGDRSRGYVDVFDVQILAERHAAASALGIDDWDIAA